MLTGMIKNLYLQMRCKPKQPVIVPGLERTDPVVQEVYDFCLSMFGAPADAEIPLVVHQGPYSVCFYSRWTHCYIIVIGREITERETWLEMLAHEMYHRFQAYPLQKHRDYLKEELLARLTSQWFLEHKGLTEYIALGYGGLLHGSPMTATFTELAKIQPQPGLLKLLRGTSYPPNYYEQIARLGIALDAVVDEASLIKLHHADSFDTWIEGLPIDRKAVVKRLLKISYDEPIKETYWGLVNFGIALSAMGDYAEAIAIFNKAEALSNNRTDHLDHLARAYLESQCYKHAIDTWQKELDLCPTDGRICFNIGFTYREYGKLVEAIEWFEKAIALDYDNAYLRNELADAFDLTGDHANARAQWERIVQHPAPKSQIARAKDGLNKPEYGPRPPAQP